MPKNLLPVAVLVDNGHEVAVKKDQSYGWHPGAMLALLGPGPKDNVEAASALYERLGHAVAREQEFRGEAIPEVRIQEIAFAFRKRTSCVEYQVVIEMLREFKTDLWETIASCFQFRLMNLCIEETHKSWNIQLVTMVKKKSGKLTMLGFRLIAMFPTICRLHSKTLQQLAGQALQTRRRNAVRPRPCSTDS